MDDALRRFSTRWEGSEWVIDDSLCRSGMRRTMIVIMTMTSMKLWVRMI